MKTETNQTNLSLGEYHLPPDIAAAVRKHGRKVLMGNLIRSLIFYAVSMTILFVTESHSDLFTREAQPGWFWGIFGILAVFPWWKWHLYQLIVCRKVYGTVEGFKNRRAIGDEKGEDTGGLSSRVGMSMRYIDVCTMVIRSDHGLRHRFTAYNEKANFIRDNYKPGDRVFYPMFAAYPFNMSREPARPFCLCCGYTGTADETVCPECGVPFIKPAQSDTSEPEKPMQSI